MPYLFSGSVVVDFRHGAKGRPEFVHGWSGRVGLAIYNTHKERRPVNAVYSIEMQHSTSID